MRVVSFEIRIACDHCGSAGKLPHTSVNHRVRCSACGKTFLAVADPRQIEQPHVLAVSEWRAISMTCSRDFKRFAAVFRRDKEGFFVIVKTEKLNPNSTSTSDQLRISPARFDLSELNFEGIVCPYCGDRGRRQHGLGTDGTCGALTCDGGWREVAPTWNRGVQEWRVRCACCKENYWASMGEPDGPTNGFSVDVPHSGLARTRSDACQIEAPKPSSLMAPLRRLLGGRQ